MNVPDVPPTPQRQATREEMAAAVDFLDRQDANTKQAWRTFVSDVEDIRRQLTAASGGAIPDKHLTACAVVGVFDQVSQTTVASIATYAAQLLIDQEAGRVFG